MDLCLKVSLHFFLLRGAQSVNPVSWLPCVFTDENITLITEDQKLKVNMTPIYRNVVLQFGPKEDPPVKPDTLTFLITPSKLNIRRFLSGAEVGELSCALARYSTDGSQVRWPVRGEHEYNRWFTLHISHSRKLFNIMAFIRQSTDQPPTGQDDYKSWTVIQDYEIVTTSVVMVLQTPTPVVMSPLKSQPRLPCLFSIDHKAANVAVKWYKLGKNTSVFKHNSQAGRPEGSGVSLQQLAAGDATYTVPNTEVSSEGTYVCSVNVHPLQGSLTVELKIIEPPSVSLNVDPILTLDEFEEKTVVCQAHGFYPLDVDMHWTRRGVTDVGPGIEISQYSSHSTNQNGTYRKRCSFYLRPKLNQTGWNYTCSVSHRALSTPITKTFTLIVIEPGQWILVFQLILILFVLVIMLPYCCKGKKYRAIPAACTELCL